MRRVWHPEHFTCSQCDTELGNITFYEHNDTPYCEKDYHELFAPRCAYCNGPILDVSLNILLLISLIVMAVKMATREFLSFFSDTYTRTDVV